MSVSQDLLCAFELLKPLDSQALKKEMHKSRKRRNQQQITNSNENVPTND